MSEENPYQAPEAEVIDVSENESLLLNNPTACSSGEGLAWIGEAFSLFARSPWMWILLCVIFMGISLLTAFIPLGGVALTLFTYVLIAGIVLGCQSLEQGRELTVEHLFKGFRHESMGALVICGALVLGISMVIVVVILVGAFVFAGMAAFMATAEQNLAAGSIGLGMLLVFLVGVALTLPILMMTWFAPPLIIFHRQSAWDAMKLSFKGCLKNIVPFLLYGLVMLVLGVLAAIPLGLGYLVLVPVATITIYTSYKGVFLTADKG